MSLFLSEEDFYCGYFSGQSLCTVETLFSPCDVLTSWATFLGNTTHSTDSHSKGVSQCGQDKGLEIVRESLFNNVKGFLEVSPSVRLFVKWGVGSPILHGMVILWTCPPTWYSWVAMFSRKFISLAWRRMPHTIVLFHWAGSRPPSDLTKESQLFGAQLWPEVRCLLLAHRCFHYSSHLHSTGVKLGNMSILHKSL